MVLVPEQVSNMREENRRIRERIPGYSDYFQNKELSSAEYTEGRPMADFAIETNYQTDITTIKKNEELLATSTFLTKRVTDSIEVGTKFVVKFDHDNKQQELLLVEESVGIPGLKGFVTLNSIFGQNIKGKKETDTFSYRVNTDKYNTGVRIITGTITAIKKDPKDYLHYIKDKPYSSRLCCKEKNILHQLYQNMNIDEQSRLEYQKRLELTPSQIELIEAEIKYLKRTKIDKNLIKSRLAALRQYITKYNIASPPTDESIGIGTNFSVIINTPDGVVNRRFEMINRAVSNELEDEYIERISTLGSKIFGLKENEEFVVAGRCGKISRGIVYDIDNSQNQIKTKEPLVYTRQLNK